MNEKPVTKLPYLEAGHHLSDEAWLELESMFLAMQTEQHRRGAEQSFALPSEVLGEIALKHMNTKV